MFSNPGIEAKVRIVDLRVPNGGHQQRVSQPEQPVEPDNDQSSDSYRLAQDQQQLSAPTSQPVSDQPQAQTNEPL